jgi:hypothetical protein
MRDIDDIVVKVCPTCRIKYGIPMHLAKTREHEEQEWHCPNGHSLYHKSQSEADAVRKELSENLAAVESNRDWWKRQAEMALQQLNRQRHISAALRGVIKRMKRKAAP